MMHPSQLTIAILSKETGISQRQLAQCAREAGLAYAPKRQKYCRKKRKWRLITPPTRQTKRLLRRVHRALQRMICWLPCVHSGPRGKSCQTAARPHLGKAHLIVRDIHQCYPSVSGQLLYERLLHLGLHRGVARLLVGLSIHDGQLPQGSPLSSTVLNLFLWESDTCLSAKMKYLKASYQRYADDMVVSVNDRARVVEIGEILDQEIGSVGLTVSQKKRIELSKATDAVVLGVKVNNPRGTMCPRELEATALSQAQAFVRGCKVVSASSLVPLARRRASLEGLMHHMRQMDFSPARRLRKLIEEGDLWVRMRLREVGLQPKRGKWWLHAPRKGKAPSSRSVCARLASRWSAHIAAAGQAVVQP